jgi:hypothetical protein
MNQFLSKIGEMFENQSKMINKRFDRLEKRHNSLRDRVLKLEKKKANPIKNSVKAFDCYKKVTFESEKTLRNALNCLEHTECRKNLGRKNPQLFTRFAENQFTTQQNCNIHLKGCRLYVFEDSSWRLVTEQRPFLDGCRDNLWVHFNDFCKEILEPRDAWQKHFKSYVSENEARKCPMTNSYFRKILAKYASEAAKNRGV